MDFALELFKGENIDECHRAENNMISLVMSGQICLWMDGSKDRLVFRVPASLAT